MNYNELKRSIQKSSSAWSWLINNSDANYDPTETTVEEDWRRAAEAIIDIAYQNGLEEASLNPEAWGVKISDGTIVHLGSIIFPAVGDDTNEAYCVNGFIGTQKSCALVQAYKLDRAAYEIHLAPDHWRSTPEDSEEAVIKDLVDLFTSDGELMWESSAADKARAFISRIKKLDLD